jgi:hypothetical protein
MKKTQVMMTDMMFIAEFRCGSDGGSYVFVKSIDLNKSVKISRDYSMSDNDQIAHILDKLGLDYLARNTRGKNDVYLYKWDWETLEKNFTKKNLDS